MFSTIAHDGLWGKYTSNTKQTQTPVMEFLFGGTNLLKSLLQDSKFNFTHSYMK